MAILSAMWTKVLSRLLLPPGLLAVLLLVAALFWWSGRRKRGFALGLFAFLLLYALSTPWMADLLAGTLESRYPPVPVADSPTAEAIVVLGGGIGPVQPPRLAADLDSAADRVLHAARLYRAGKAELIVASGGLQPWTGTGQPEGSDMADLLVEWGVPREAILAETRSADTHDNAVETARVLKARGATRILLVTSALHMPRSVATFEATGLEVVPSTTDFLAVQGEPRTVLDWTPDAGALDRSSRALHEWLGRLYYALRGWT